MIRRSLLSIASSLALAVALLSTTAYADCGTLLTNQDGLFPHQGAQRHAAAGSFIYGASANISYSNPYLGCAYKGDSFTTEWVMVVGPGPEEWLQFGWRRISNYPNVHLWYQYHHQGGNPVDGDIPYEPATTHEYKLMSVRLQSGIMSWWVVDTGNVLAQFTATDMGWSQPTNGATEVQWSGELTYDESEMGGLLPGFVTIDNLYYQEGSPYDGWQPTEPTAVFNSFAAKYGGDTTLQSPFVWQSRNWTWPHQIFLPLLMDNV